MIKQSDIIYGWQKGKILTHEVKHINIVRSSKDWPYTLQRVSDCENMIYYISVYRIMGRTPMIYDIHKKTTPIV